MFKRIVVEVDKEILISAIIDKKNVAEIKVVENDNAILLYDNKIRGMIGGESAKILVTSDDTTVEIIVDVANCPLPNTNNNLFKPITISPNPLLHDRSDFTFGADISTIYEVLRCNGKFYNDKGNQESVFSLLKKGGFDCVRLRLWNDPNFPNGAPYGGGHNDLPTNIYIAKIVKAMGLKLMINFHYSDFWADPAKQSIPKQWSNLKNACEIEKAIYDYTFFTLAELDSNGVLPEFVQVGNEITNGMIIHNAYSPDDDISHESKKIKRKLRGNFAGRTFLKYINAGCNAVKDFNKNIDVVIHIDRGTDNKRCNKFFDGIKKVNYNIIGLSYYSFYHGHIKAFCDNVTKLAIKYNKKIIVAETSYAFTTDKNPNCTSVFANPKNINKNWEISPLGQAEKIKDIVDVLVNLPNNLGVGIYYWEPCWLPITGAGWAKYDSLPSWSDQALFSYEGKKLPSLDIPNLLKGKA